MKSLLLAATALAVVVYSTAAFADDSWRSPGKSLYGGPSGDAMSQEFQNRGRLDEALRNGEAGLVGDTTIIQVQTTAGGCLSTQETKVEGATNTNTNSNITCNNSGDVNATTNITIGSVKK